MHNFVAEDVSLLPDDVVLVSSLCVTVLDGDWKFAYEA
jgi:hypothetical protein